MMSIKNSLKRKNPPQLGQDSLKKDMLYMLKKSQIFLQVISPSW
jgi:hypothetical protein